LGRYLQKYFYSFFFRIRDLPLLEPIRILIPRFIFLLAFFGTILSYILFFVLLKIDKIQDFDSPKFFWKRVAMMISSYMLFGFVIFYLLVVFEILEPLSSPRLQRGFHWALSFFNSINQLLPIHSFPNNPWLN
jgi:hypothetical protein